MMTEPVLSTLKNYVGDVRLVTVTAALGVMWSLDVANAPAPPRRSLLPPRMRARGRARS